MKTFVAWKFGQNFRVAAWPGECIHCGLTYVKGDKVNWNPRVKNTCCHAGCYIAYGSPKGGVPTPVVRKPKEETVFPYTAPKPEVVKPEVNGDLAKTLAEAIKPHLDQRLNVTKTEIMDAVQILLKDSIFKTVTTVEVIQRDDNKMTVRDMGIQHMTFPLLLQALQARTQDDFALNIWLVGPAGTGKTTAAKNAAKALGLQYQFTGSIDSEYKLLGFVDAQGKVINTAFRKAYIHGGVFLFDECDSSMANALLAFNAALANGECAFPDGVFPRHKDFICIAAANTYGLGQTIEYCGRLKMDAAFLDRFVQVEWDIDEALELALCTNSAWCKKVQAWRKAVKANGFSGVMISPRASYFGASLLATGMDEEAVTKMVVIKAMKKDQWNTVKGAH